LRPQCGDEGGIGETQDEDLLFVAPNFRIQAVDVLAAAVSTFAFGIGMREAENLVTLDAT
jgi:hypothetical protein